MTKYTNVSGVSLPLAVWLVHDDYDYVNDPNYISVTTLMKPVRQVILAKRNKDRTIDVQDLIPSSLGSSIHAGIEHAWTTKPHQILEALGISAGVIDRVRINPDDNEVLANPELIPIYLEQRMKTNINGWVLGGKFDQVIEGMVHDFKTTSAYTWAYGDRGKDYTLQGSLYRWIDSRQGLSKIREDMIQINFIFTDWQRAQTKSNPKYPQSRLESKQYPLMSLKDTENFVLAKLAQLEKFAGSPEKDLPRCTDEELWMSEPKYKYFANPANTSGRSTKNFDSKVAAYAHLSAQGKGVVIEEPSVPKRCAYCPAFEVCSQKDEYKHD